MSTARWFFGAGVLRVVADRALLCVERRSRVRISVVRGCRPDRRRTSRAVAATMSPLRGKDARLADRVLDVPVSTMSAAEAGHRVQVLDQHQRRADGAAQVEGQIDVVCRRCRSTNGSLATPTSMLLIDELARRQVGDRHAGIGVGELEQRLEVVAGVGGVVADLVGDEQRLPAAAAADVADDGLAVAPARS